MYRGGPTCFFSLTAFGIVNVYYVMGSLQLWGE